MSKRKAPKPRNPVARALAKTETRQRVIPDKKRRERAARKSTREIERDNPLSTDPFFDGHGGHWDD